MRTIKTLLLAIWAITICSCDKDDDQTSQSDFSVLGVSSVTVNNVTYEVNEKLFWVTDGATPFYVTATEMTTATKHCTIDYIVSSSGETKEASATSTYSDVLVVVTAKTTTDGIVYKVIDITRPNHEEHLTYNIFFADIQD
jgi:hypothetical protein